jgi:S1/P1 nuclease
MKQRRLFGRTIAFGVGCLILCTPTISLGWGAGGHMMVARIAFGRLNPRAKAQVAKLLAINVTRPGLSPKSQRLLAAANAKTKDFVNAAHWADDLRPITEFDSFKELHFIDTPFSDDGTALPSVPTPTIINALQDDVNTLKTSTDDNERAQALRFIIHFVGDIHQPLHCTTRVSATMPNGDRGGNQVSIKLSKKKKTNLHSYWDGGLATFPPTGPNFAPPPLSSIGPAVAKAVAGNPATNPDIKLDDPTNYQAWADESFALAKDKVYPGIANGGTPTNTYRTKGIKVARQRVAWAGYRLAALLNSIWP